MTTTCYEDYPYGFILISNILQLAIYAIGASVIYRLGIIWLVLYLLYIAILEIRLLKTGCINCYYYAKRCAFGKGKLCSLFFKKGDTAKFIKKQIKWYDIIPDFMVTIIPMIVGIILLITNFNWILLSLVVLLFLLGFIGNGIVRGSLACKYCKQREIGCPAEKLFQKKKK